MGQFRVTAYCSCSECSEDYGKLIAWTGDGHTEAKTYHTIAVDPDVIPYGSLVEIEGFDCIFVAEDCGGMVNGNHIDVYLGEEGSHADTDAFGVQELEVWILEDE